MTDVLVLKGAVFEVRQGYKSKDSKRQNADIGNAGLDNFYVGPINDLPIDFSTWVTADYPEVGDPSTVTSGDGMKDGLKFAFGLNPLVINPPASIPLPSISGNLMTLSYNSPNSVSGVTYGAQWSTDLVTWNSIPDTGSGNYHVFSVSVDGQKRLFMRHNIEINP